MTDAFPVQVQLAATESAKAELEALEKTSVWPNGDAAAQLSMRRWLLLFVAAIYPPSLLVTLLRSAFGARSLGSSESPLPGPRALPASRADHSSLTPLQSQLCKPSDCGSRSRSR